ncbi:VWA domain-containing protein [Streptomyces tuirus]|uniref:VWA domain-containing protein n=1 Tax=Streptomyces tuirus TaxID=68278 RepID=UPI00342D92B2
MGILTRLRNAFGRPRKSQTAEAEGAAQTTPAEPTISETTPTAPAAAPKVPSPSPEPTPGPTATVPEPRDDEHDLVSAAFDKVAVPRPADSTETTPPPEPPRAKEPAVAEEAAEAEPERPAVAEEAAEAETEAPAVAEEAAEAATETPADAEEAAETEPETPAVAEEPTEAATETTAVAEEAAEAEPEAPAVAEEPAPTDETPVPADTKPETEPEAKAPAPEAAAADGDPAPQGPPAPDNESSTGGAGGNKTAEGEAEAEAPAAKPKRKPTKPTKATPKPDTEPKSAEDGPAVPLTRVKTRAPGLTTAYNAATTTLASHNLTGTRAKVYLVLDRSASMRPYYKDGSAQALAEQTLALAAHLDPEATVPVVFFSTELDGTGEITLTDHENKIDDLHAGLGRMGRTSYHAAVEAVLAHHDKTAADATPALVVFQTDGAPDAKTPATQALTGAAKTHPTVFFSFVAFGDPENKAFDYLRKLKTPNTSHFLAGETPRELTDKELYEGVLANWRP